MWHKQLPCFPEEYMFVRTQEKNFYSHKNKKTTERYMTNSTRKISKIPARKNLSKFRKMTLERRSIKYDDRTTFNQTFNVIRKL